MSTTIQISPETYQLLQRRAREMKSTPEQMAEEAIRLQLGNTVHIEQKQTAQGPQAYVRGTRVAVRHIAAFLKAGHMVEEITQTGLPHVSAAAIYEAIAYYYDHREEIEAELAAEAPEAVQGVLEERLSGVEYGRLTGESS